MYSDETWKRVLEGGPRMEHFHEVITKPGTKAYNRPTIIGQLRNVIKERSNEPCPKCRGDRDIIRVNGSAVLTCWSCRINEPVKG